MKGARSGLTNGAAYGRKSKDKTRAKFWGSVRHGGRIWLYVRHLVSTCWVTPSIPILTSLVDPSAWASPTYFGPTLDVSKAQAHLRSGPRLPFWWTNYRFIIDIDLHLFRLIQCLFLQSSICFMISSSDWSSSCVWSWLIFHVVMVFIFIYLFCVTRMIFIW